MQGKNNLGDPILALKMFDRFTINSTFSSWKAEHFALLIEKTFFSLGFLKNVIVAIETIFCLRTAVPGSAADNYIVYSCDIIKKNNNKGIHVKHSGTKLIMALEGALRLPW